MEWLQQIHAKWTLVAGQDWNQILLAAKPVYAAGIMPVCRLVWPIDKYTDFSVGVKLLLAAGIPPYIQIWNEPGNPREWRHKIDIGRFGQSWADNATVVFDSGGYPGINCLGIREWKAAFDAVKAMDRMDIWSRAWFCLHNGGSNHPPSYPYDEVNQHGVPVSPAEYAAHSWASTIEEVNQWRAANKHPGATVMDDDTTVLRFFEFKQWMVESLGYSLPIIGGEAGWAYGAMEDNRYPKIDAGLHAAYFKEICEWFRTGTLSNGDPLPDELFSVSNWIMSDWGADDWWYGTLGTKQQTIDAVASIPKFSRKFAKDRATPQPLAPITYIVQPGDTLWAISRRFGVTVPSLAVENKIADPSKIRAGQKLTISGRPQPRS